MILKLDFRDDGIVYFSSSFVETPCFAKEEMSGRVEMRTTFGTGRSIDSAAVNADTIKERKVVDALVNAGDVAIKNTANTHCVLFGGKLLALFEAGAPWELDPDTLETVGPYSMNGNVPLGEDKEERLAVKLDIPNLDFLPKMNGRAHTAHPKRCPLSGRMVSWTWAQDPTKGILDVRVSEYEEQDAGSFREAFGVDFNLDVDLAPHDFAITRNYCVFVLNALSMEPAMFMAGLKGPAECLKMDGREKVKVALVPRPSGDKAGESPIIATMDACFAIHFSHAYEDGNEVIAHFSGWPENDSKTFLGAWGGQVPEFDKIPPTFIWRLTFDLNTSEASLKVANNCRNICGEHLKVHPLFQTKKCDNVYVVSSNTVGTSSPPAGYSGMKVEEEEEEGGALLKKVDSYWWGNRFFAMEPVIAPKIGAKNEYDGYLLGMVQDTAKDVAFLAIFDLAKGLAQGPVAEVEIPFRLPHGLHGSWKEAGNLSSYF